MRSEQTGSWGRWALGLCVAAALGLGLASVAGAATTVRRVDDSDVGCNSSGPVYCNIQDAIDDATAGDTVYVKPGLSGFYPECLEIDKRINVVAGGDVTIGGCPVAVLISGSRARFQGFSAVEAEVDIEITGSDNIVAANRLTGCGTGILLDDGAARNLVVANVINCGEGIELRDVGAGTAGPNNQLLHNVIGNAQVAETAPGILISASQTTLIGNAVTWSGGPGIDIQQLCESTKIKQTALSKNVAAQNNQEEEPTYFDIRMDPRSQRPVLKGNTYQTSGLSAELVPCRR